MAEPSLVLKRTATVLVVAMRLTIMKTASPELSWTKKLVGSNSTNTSVESTMFTVAMVSSPRTAPAEGLLSTAVNCSVSSATVSDIVGTLTIKDVSPGLKVTVRVTVV